MGRHDHLADISAMKTDDIDRLIVRNIVSLLEEKDLKPTRLSLDAGLSRTAVADIINGKSRSPAYATIVKLADAAGVRPERITVGPDSLPLSEDERAILDLSAQLPLSLRRKLLGYGEGLLAAREPDDD